ncbi:MAG: DUF933 domain-containing protein [Candidatus Omnitrophica bacterium]|nr:DUF933 domain-containing protein [Candidatus Omnitrophota bacterium]
MKIALLGYAGSGKTEMVSVLSGKRHESFDPLKPATVSVKIHDERLRRISEIAKPQKITEAEITLVDIKGAAEGTGFDEKPMEIAVLQDRVALVIPAFLPERNPINELCSLYLEMVYRDQERIKSILEKRQQDILHGRRKKGQEEEMLEKCLVTLEKENFLSTIDLDRQQSAFLGSLGLITVKKFFVIAKGKIITDDFYEFCHLHHLRFCQIDAGAFDKNRIASFWDQFLTAAGLLRFYTITGKETRAWLLSEGATVLDAAATIHTDIAAGFVRADVVKYEDFISHGSFSICREKGLLRSEAKTGIIKDWDIIYIHKTR